MSAPAPRARNSPVGLSAPKQARSERTLRRLHEATENLLVSGGPGRLSVQRIIADAGSSAGSFYARFESREAIVRYTQDAFWRSIEDQWDAFFESERVAGRRNLLFVARAVRSLVRSMIADRERLRAFLVLALQEPELGIGERIRDLDDHIVAGLVRQLSGRADSRSTEIAAAARGVLGTARDTVLFGDPMAPAEPLILAGTRSIARAAGARRAPTSYAQLLTLCRD